MAQGHTVKQHAQDLNPLSWALMVSPHTSHHTCLLQDLNKTLEQKGSMHVHTHMCTHTHTLLKYVSPKALRDTSMILCSFKGQGLILSPQNVG